MDLKKVILPIDGFSDFEKIRKTLELTFNIPGVRDIISHIKLNDVVYNKDGVFTMQFVQNWLINNDLFDVDIFLDLKLSDTDGTNINILKHYTELGLFPNILTIRECCSSKTFKKVRELLPNTTLALVSVLTDTSEEECVFRYGMKPVEKIAKDTKAINELCPGCLDAVVCSPLEVEQLKESFPEMKFIVPGIRDSWMQSGQQKRFAGIRFTIESGADWVVVGGQITKGNPDNNISAEKSVLMTISELNKVQMIVVGDYLQTLKNFDAVYESPKDEQGNFLGPLVAYAGLDNDGKPKVGYHYYNMARIEENPRALKYFAKELAKKIKVNPSVVLGAPMGGLALAQALSQELNCQFAFAEKNVLLLGSKANGTKNKEELVTKRHEIKKGDHVLVVEDLCNNFSTTDELYFLINSFGAQPIGTACIVNRSIPTINSFKGISVISAVDLPTDQYEQTDEKVKKHLDSGNLVLKPKHEWQVLKDAMSK